MDDLHPGAPLRDHLRDQFGRVLQVGVDDDHGLAAAVPQTGEDRRFLAEVAAERETPDPWFTGRESTEALEGVVPAAVIDHEDLPGRGAGLKDLGDGCERPFQAGALVVGRDQDADLDR